MIQTRVEVVRKRAWLWLLPVLFICLAELSGRAAAQQTAFERGVDSFNHKEYQKAISLFESSLRGHPQDPNALYYSALCYARLGEHEEARRLYTAIVEKFPQSVAAKNARAALKSVALSPFAERPRSARPHKRSAQESPEQASALPFAGESMGTLQAPEQARIYYRNVDGNMYVEGQINGRPMSMIFDTGASTTYLGKNHLAELGVKAPEGASAGFSGGVGERGLERVWKTRLDIKLGPIERKNFECTVSDHADVPLLGQTFFRDFEYTIDKADNSIVLEKRNSSCTARINQNDGYSVPFKREGNEIVVSAEVNDTPLAMYFDTGASSTCFTISDLEKLKGAGNLPEGTRMGTASGVGGSTSTLNFPIRKIKLGPIEKRNFNVCVVLSSSMKRPLLGQTFFGDWKYTIDNQNKRIHFVRR